MRGRLTRRLLESEAAREAREVWDAGEGACPGLYARHQGGRWRFVLKYRLGGKVRHHRVAEDGAAVPPDACARLGLTDGATWTPEAARKEAERVRGRLRAGENPDADRRIPTFEAFAVRYMAEHAVPFKRPRSVEEDRGLLTRHLLPAFGALRLDRIDRAAVTRFALERKATPTTANRALALLSHIFTMAGKWGVLPEGNPVRGVPRYREARRERFLSADELARLGAALAELESEGTVSPFALAAVRFLLFTGARPAEALSMTWGMVDFEARVVRLPESKTGQKALVLSAPAAELLAELPRTEGEARVFPPRQAERMGRRVAEADLESAWRRIRARAGLEDVRLYDACRHGFASLAVAGGASLFLVGKLLGHAKATTTERYAHLADDPQRAVAEAVGGRIAAALAGRKPAPPEPMTERRGARR